MNIAIITNGDIEDVKKLEKYLTESDYIICADGAARYLKELDLLPDLLVGDFDSIENVDTDWMFSRGVKQSKFPREKDKTDTELAIDFAFDRNPNIITLIGATGSRLDHSLGNIFLLKKILDKNILGRIIGENFEMYLIDGTLNLEGQCGDIISLIPLTTEVKGVTISEVLYPLDKANMGLGSTWGISNEFINNSTVTISIEEGLLLVIKTRE